MKGSTTSERCAASAGAAFEATGVGADVATGAVRFAPRKYHALAATNMTNATIPSAIGASKERLLGWRGLRLRRLADFERIDPDRLGDVLELGRAEIADRQIEPPLDLAIGILGQADRAGLGDAFQPRGDIDAVAHQVAVALLDHVAEMDADAELDAPVGRHAGIALDHAVLHFDGAAHGVDDAAELDDRPSPVRLTTRP